MARVNFEDDIEAQHEFWRLLALLGGDRIRSLGSLVLFFRIAQKAYGHDKPMTEDDLRSQDLGCMIDSGWAVPVEGGYQALGAAKHFDWYRQKVEAGKKGGRPKEETEEKPTGSLPVSADNRTVPPANPLAPAPSLVSNTNTSRSSRRKRLEYTTAFEEIYELYPEKVGKSKAWGIYQRDIKTSIDRDSLVAAIQKYVAYCRSKDRYLKNFDTFMGQWRDWADPSAGASSQTQDRKLKTLEDLENESA